MRRSLAILRFSLAPRSKCVSKAVFAKQSAMRIVFNGKETLRSLSNYSENPIARFSWQRFDGNVEVVTWILDTATGLRLRFGLNVVRRFMPHRNAECSSIRYRSATDLRQFRQPRDAAAQTRFVTVRFTSRKTLNRRSLLFVPRAIAWRPHCMVRVCQRSWSSTAIAVTDRSFT